MARLQQKCANGLFRTQKHAQNHFTLRFKLQARATNLLMVAASLTENVLQGGPKKSVFSKNENRPWWEFFEKKIHDQ